MSPDAGLGRRLHRLLGSLFRDPSLTSDHLLITADACDEVERELRVAGGGGEAPHAVVELDAEEVRMCSAHLRAVASRYSDAPLPLQGAPQRQPIEDMPVAALACLPPATLIHQARVILKGAVDCLEEAPSGAERLTMSSRLRHALLALAVAEDDVEALQVPVTAVFRLPARPELRLVQGEESF